MKILKNTNKKVNLVSVPIGNLEDITLRAINVLKNSDIIYCENKMISSKLLLKYDINCKLRTLHKFNENEKAKEIIEMCNASKNVSIISDAGTPLINDPGTFLAKTLVENDIMLLPVGGISCLTTTLSINTFNSDKFVYIGFVDSRHKEKIKFINTSKIDIVALVSPHYIVKFIKELNKTSNREVILAKELTKLHETHIYTSTSKFIESYKDLNLKGEFTVIIKGIIQENPIEDVEKTIINLLNQNLKTKEIVKKICEIYNTNKNDVYELILKLKENDNG